MINYPKEVQDLLNALAHVDDLNGRQIMTSEHRANREQASAFALDLVRPAIAALDALAKTALEEETRHMGELRKANRRLVHERDAAQERAEKAKANVDLWSKTGGHLPVVGLTCDTEDCASAIGIVGVKAIDLSKVDEAMLSIARAARWSTVETFGTDLMDRKLQHFCPTCTKARAAKGTTP